MIPPDCIPLMVALVVGLSGAPPAPPQTPVFANSGDTVAVSVEDMVRLAVEKNLALRSRKYARDMSRADLLGARAAFDPNWALSLDHSTTDTDVVGGSLYNSGFNALSVGVGGTLPLSTSYAVGASVSDAFADPVQGDVGPFANNYSTGMSLSLTQPLLRGFGPGPANAFVRAARHRTQAADADVDRAVELTVWQTEEAFWLLRFMETLEQVAGESLQRAQDIYDRNVSLRARDMVTELDVITARRTLAQRRTSLLDAQRQRSDAAEALLFLVYGEDAAAELQGGGMILMTRGGGPAAPELPDSEQVERLALASRADMAGVRSLLESGKSELSATRSALLPALDLTLGLQYGGTADVLRFFAYPNANNNKSTVLSMGASLSLPQFNRGARASHQAASLAVRQAEVTVLAAENRVRLEVRSAARSVRLGQLSLTASDSLVSLAQQEYDMARRGLDLGQISIYELFQYEGDLMAARITHAEDEYQLATAVSAYYLSIGHIGERYGIRPGRPTDR